MCVMQRIKPLVFLLFLQVDSVLISDGNSVLVYLNFYNKTPKTGQLTYNRNFLTVLETEKSRIKVQADSGAWQGLLSP